MLLTFEQLRRTKGTAGLTAVQIFERNGITPEQFGFVESLMPDWRNRWWAVNSLHNEWQDGLLQFCLYIFRDREPLMWWFLLFQFDGFLSTVKKWAIDNLDGTPLNSDGVPMQVYLTELDYATRGMTPKDVCVFLIALDHNLSPNQPSLRNMDGVEPFMALGREFGAHRTVPYLEYIKDGMTAELMCHGVEHDIDPELLMRIELMPL